MHQHAGGGANPGAPKYHEGRPRPMAAHFPPLAEETREVVPTDCAAFHLNRQPQTLRGWACLDNGPLRPVRIVGRLGWRTADLRRILGVDQ